MNEKFGTDFREKDKVAIRQLEERLPAHESLADSIRGPASPKLALLLGERRRVELSYECQLK